MAETNLIRQGFQKFVDWVYTGKQMDEYEEALTARQREMIVLQQYYQGRQVRPLQITPNGKDYNVMGNMTGIIIARTVSMLMGGGIDFNSPDDTAQAAIDGVYEANHGDILLHDLAQFGSIYGTAFMKIIPDGRDYKGKKYPRLIALNPYHMLIVTAQDDIENILKYVNRWNDGDTAWREITEKQEGRWYVRMEKASRDTKGLWQQEGDEVVWEYDWAPIAHVKNLPAAGDVYGLSDIEGVIELQDRYNAGQSDINVILGNNAFPLRFITGGRLPRRTLSNGQEVVDITPAKILEFTNSDTKMGVAEMESDLSSSRAFVKDVRSDIFDISATVDSETMRNSVHQITNFGLRVMYKDELAKNATKQMLYGSLLREVNQHILDIYGMQSVDAGDVIWGDPLPTNTMEEVNTLQADINMGILSKKTATQIRDYDFDQEQENITEDRAQEKTLGGNLLRDFLAGGGNA